MTEDEWRARYENAKAVAKDAISEVKALRKDLAARDRQLRDMEIERNMLRITAQGLLEALDG